uniref:FTH domain-containing protein n=2 Tax=Caenorhabditis tropicalis TaxID=1561998 RepID=A0A1I7TNW8_9PELO
MHLCRIECYHEILFNFPLVPFFKCEIGLCNFRLHEKSYSNGKQKYILEEYSVHIQNTKCDEPTIRNFIERVVQVFHKPKIVVRCFGLVRCEFVVEMIRLLNNGMLQEVMYSMTDSSKECYNAVFNEAAKLKKFSVQFPPKFRFSPPTPLKLDELTVSGPWLKMDDFMDCKTVNIFPDIKENKLKWNIAVNLNKFFKRLKGSECRIENICIKAKMEDKFRLRIIKGVGDTFEEFNVNFLRKDRKKSMIWWTEKEFCMETDVSD